MPENQLKKPHLLVTDTATTEPYTSPSSGRNTFNLPPRQRQAHGQRLQRQFDLVREQAKALVVEQKAFGIDAVNGIYLQFESEPDFELTFERLEALSSGIELLAVKQVENKTLATVFVPDGKLDILTRKLADYLNPAKDSPKGAPKNKPLIESIASIQQAVLETLWTDAREELPGDCEAIWWEVWLRADDDPNAYLQFFKEHASRLEIMVEDAALNFPDRTVVAAYATRAQMGKSVKLLNCIAELRKAKDTADFFTSMPRNEQFTWINDILPHLTPPAADSPAVCLLDTGVNNSHPLLKPVLNESDLHTCNPAWHVSDHKGHGTEMAGLAAYGDLTELLAGNGPIELTHALESVKILPPVGQNHPHLYGDITAEAVSRVEITAPDRQRNICLAVTTTDFRDAGRPSSWSASIDALCAGADDETPRLFIIAAGNTERASRHHYPDSNMTEGIHDPGQAWNAITVGAFTEKDLVDQAEYPGWTPLASVGDLSPASCTSLNWSRPWPLKPDIVMEGGNMALDPTGTADNVGSLDLLTINFQYAISRPMINTGDTSAATALASRMAAILQAQYPDYWPETIRALLVHSAEWTSAMKERFAPFRRKEDYENLLRYCGYGVASIDRALWSANNALTLVAQDSLQPFDKKGSRGVTRDLNLHDIPWPTELLLELGDVPVEMRVTLSYFIEPNPARRGWGRKYSYASHGLRFEVRRPLESVEDFRHRINKAAWDEETSRQGSSPTDAKWLLGKNLRKQGSIHSNTWSGTAAELAQRGHIAIFPVMGWWRENVRHQRWGSRARYSLVVTIRTPETEVDIYTPVAMMVAQPVLVQI